MRRKKRRTQSEVELNLAAMLDMAFQLLTFFILTFKPAPIEGQVLLRMPPPQPITNINSGERVGSDPKNTNPLQGLSTLVVSVLANPDGSLKQMAVGESPIAGITAFDRKLAEVFGDAGSGFDQVIVQVDSRLHYGPLMQVIDVCTRQKLADGEPLSKLSFVELPASGQAANN
jgi:biopolymer transport protein ExbD